MNNLKEKRKAAGLSQARLAELAGCARSYVAEVELGHKKLTLKQSRLFAAHLHCDPFELMGDDVVKYDGESLADFIPTVRALVTRYFDLDLLEDEKIPAQTRLRYWICFDLMNGDFSDDDLETIERLTKKLGGLDK